MPDTQRTLSNVTLLDGQTYYFEDESARAMPAPVEEGSTASKSYAIGDLIVLSGKLYKVASPISNGGTFVVGTNIVLTTIDAELKTIREDKTLGLSNTAAGDLVRVASIDANGKPTSWEKAPLCDIATNQNLLDNWYFVGGGSQQGGSKLPINQRRLIIWQNEGYTIDRWKLMSGTASLSEAGLLLTGTLVQIRETPIGLPVTCSALLSDGTLITPTYDDTLKTFTLTATGQTIKAVKLELGEEQTLAHQENGVWVLNELPNFNDEFMACKRYYQRFLNNGIYVGMERDTVEIAEDEDDPENTTTYGTLWFNIPVPVQMRSTPTITAIPDTPAVENGPLVDWNYYICTSSGLYTAKNAKITAVYNLGNTMNINLQHSAVEIPAYTSVNVLIPGLEADAEL